MAAPVDDSRVVIPFMPSLLHFATVKTAIPLLEEFGCGMVTSVHKDIQQGNSTAANKDSRNICIENFRVRHDRARKKLLHIPSHLRKNVVNAVTGMQNAVDRWEADHSYIPKLNFGKYKLYWRSDGTINGTKTAQGLVLNKNFNIRKRFEIACIYCFEKSIQTLWSEMMASRKSKNFRTANGSMVYFWTGRMHDSSQVHWTQALVEYICSLEAPPVPAPEFSSFFPSLLMEDRQKCLIFLNYARDDDFRLCLCTMTREEQTKAIDVRKLLTLCLVWPLQSVFLETAEKLWNCMDVEDFLLMLDLFFTLMTFNDGYDYRELFEGFWNRSPNHLREKAKECSYLSRMIDSWLNGKKRKRKAVNVMNKQKKK